MAVPPSKWTVSGEEIVFIAVNIQEEGGNRIVERERPYRDGAKLDDTGSKARRWTVETVWQNTLEEDDVPVDPPFYPDRLNLMLSSADMHETGDLQLPTRSKIRCRLQSYRRTEDDTVKEMARVTFVFVQDNEDAVDVGVLQYPSAGASVRTMADATVFSLESRGSVLDAITEFEDAVDDLNDAIAAPGELVQDVDQKAARVVRACESVERQVIVTGNFATERLDPMSHAALRQLRTMADLAARAANDRRNGLGKIVTVMVETQMSIFDVAVKYGKDPQQLMSWNSHVENFLVIPARTQLRMFQK
jgi:prophage DNA circulation protein